MSGERSGSSELQIKKDRFGESVSRLRKASESIGTAAYAQRPDFMPENYSGVDKILKSADVAGLRRQIELKILQVGARISAINGEIEAAKLDVLRGRLPELEELVIKGYLDESVLGDAKRVLGGEIETPKEKELPKLKIFEDSKELEFEGRRTRISGEIGWRTLLLLAEDAGGLVLGWRIESIAEKAGSKANHKAGNAVANVRKLLGIQSDSNVIKTWYKGRHAYYQLNALVEFVGRDKTKAVPETEEKVEGIEGTEGLPHLKIDLSDKTVQYHGEVRRISGSIGWKTLVLLGHHSKKWVKGERIIKIAKSAGSKSEASGSSIRILRDILGSSFGFEEIIETRGPKNNPSYKLKATVEFEGELPETIKGRESTIKKELTLPDGTKIVLRGAVKIKLLDCLISKYGNKIPKEILEREVWGRVGKSTAVYDGVAHLREDLEKNGWTIVFYKKTRGKNAEFELKQIEKTKRVAPNLSESRAAAIRTILQNPEVTAEEIITILGPSVAGRQLTRPQALRALENATRLVYFRDKQGIATEVEADFWNEIKRATGRVDNREALDTFIASLNAWFVAGVKLSDAEREEVKKVEESSKRFSDEEALILAAAISCYDELLKQYGLEPLPRRILDRLLYRFNGKMDIASVNLQQLRISILEKVKWLVDSDEIYELIDTFSPEAEELLSYLTQANSRELLLFIEDITKHPIENWYDSLIKLGFIPGISRRRTMQPRDLGKVEAIVEPAAAPAPVSESAGRSLIQSGPEGEKPAADIQHPVSAHEPVGEKPMRVEAVRRIEKAKGLEGKDPQVRQRVNSLVQKVIATKLETFTGAQINRAFQRLKKKEQENLVEKGYVKPGFRNGKPHNYSRVDVVVMLYIHDFGNNLQQKDIKRLRVMVSEVLEQLEKGSKKA